jgi:hypothetical protein
MSAEEDVENRYLSDKPIESIDQDDFRHREYVDTLEQMIEAADPPWNIGVFGEWGSGKTSVIRMLYSRLNEKDTDYVTVEFDAWKHAEESIRTDLLLNLDQAIGKETGQNVDGEPGVLGEDEITKDLYDTEDDEDSEDLNAWEEAKRFLHESPLVGKIIYGILGVIIIGALMNLLVISGILPISGTTLSSVNDVMTAFLFPLFISVFIFMAGEVQKATSALRRKHPRKEWSGAYEQLFSQILENTDADKVLISVDNLDRCESETVYDVLVSLKTFLEKDQCIYIIPCDDQALQSHIKSIDERGEYFETQVNEREFLRKFFQTHIRIPEFIPEDIEEYAESQNQQLAEEFSKEVLDVLTQAYVKNPRRIKQSLNQLTTLSLLAEQMEDENHIRDTRLTENLDFLAKMMIIEEDYPEFYSKLEDDPRLLEDVDNHFRGDLTDEKRKARVNKILKRDRGDNDGESQLETFLYRTRGTTVENPRPFIRLGEPSYYTERGDVDNFLQNLWSNQEGEAREEIRSLNNENQPLEPYIQAIDSRLGDYASERRDDRLFGTIDTIFAVFDEFNEEQQESIAGILSGYLTLSRTQDHYPDFDPREFFRVLLKISGNDRKTILNRLAESVVTSDGKSRVNLLESFVDNAGEVPYSAKQSLSEKLTEMNGNSLEETLQVLSQTEESKTLATPILLKKAADRTEWNNKNNRFRETEHYTQFDSQAEPRGRKHYVDRLLDLKSEVDNKRENQYYNRLRQKLNDLNGQIKRTTGSRLLRELYQYVSSSGQDLNLAKVAIDYHQSYDAEASETFDDWMSDILSNWNGGNIQKILEHADSRDVDLLDNETAVNNLLDQVPNKLDNEGFIVNSLIGYIPEEYDDSIVQLLERLCENDDHSQNQLAAAIFASHPDRLREGQEVVLDICRRQFGRSDNINQKKKYVRAEAAVYDELDASEKEGFVNDKFSSLLSGDHQHHIAFREIWNKVGDKMNSKRRKTVSRNVHEQMQSELSGNIQWNQLEPLLDVIKSLSETDDIEEEEGEWIIERLCQNVVGGELRDRNISDLLDQLREFPEYYGNEDRLVNSVENLLDNKNNNQIENSGNELLNSIEN